MERLNIIFLHGFLGRPTDWSEIVQSLSVASGVQCISVDYFNDSKLNSDYSFEEWANHFNQYVRALPVGRNILVGYSLGGRLALHAFQESPELYEQAFFVSTNPGLLAEEAQLREQRMQNDKAWAHRFEFESWADLMHSWNSQAVFAHSKLEPKRNEEEYSRKALSQALTKWSLGVQKDFRAFLRSKGHNITWIVGQKDQKFFDLSRQLVNESILKEIQISQMSSHRVLFEDAKFISNSILNFLNQRKF